MNRFIGVDYHKAFSFAVVMDESGNILKKGRIDNDPHLLREFIGDGQGCTAVMEATRNWCVMHDWLEEIVDEVKLAHPMKVRAIAEAKVKTDQIDATTLAHLLRCDLLPEAHVCSKETRPIKNLLRHRMFLVRLQTMLKNRIHVLLDRYPQIRAGWKAEELFSLKGLSWLEEVELPLMDRQILSQELSLLRQIREKMQKVQELFKEQARPDERIANLDSIPGIGLLTAMLILAEIDDVRRFASPARLHAYAGLVPSTYSSGGKSFHGRIIKQGNRYLRWAMIEAVQPAITKDISLRRMHQHLSQRIGTNKATVAVARRLLTIVYRVLSENRRYRDGSM